MLWPTTTARSIASRSSNATKIVGHCGVGHHRVMGRVAMIAQIRHQHRAPLREAPRDTVPVGARAEQTMQQQHRCLSRVAVAAQM